MLRLMFRTDSAKEKLQVVTDNDSFFMANTINKLDDSLNGKTAHAENATYVDEFTFEDKDGRRLPWYDLSIGSKTVLNVFYNPEICFSQVECDSAALGNLKNLTEGCITPGIIIDLDKDDVCDVIIDDDEERTYTQVSKIYSGNGLMYNKGIVNIELAHGFNIIKDMTIEDRQFLLTGLKRYEDAPSVRHVSTKQEYYAFLNLSQEDDRRNTIFFLDRYALYGNSEVISKCRDFRNAVVLLECTGFVDTSILIPKQKAEMVKERRLIKLKNVIR